MITPIRKPPHRELLDWEKEFNTAINKIRWKIEQTIANLKTWRILQPTTADDSQPSRTPSAPSSGYSSTGSRNKPHTLLLTNHS